MDEAKTRTRRPPKRKLVEGRARSYFEALAHRDVEAMVSHWSLDGVQDIVPLGVFRGPEEIKRFLRELFAAVPGLETTVTRIVADDKHAVVEWRMTGTFEGGSFRGIEPTGRRVDMRGLDIMELQEEQILSNTAYYDGADFARQVGMLPPRDSGAERAITNTFNAVTRIRRAVNERMGS